MLVDWCGLCRAQNALVSEKIEIAFESGRSVVEGIQSDGEVRNMLQGTGGLKPLLLGGRRRVERRGDGARGRHCSLGSGGMEAARSSLNRSRETGREVRKRRREGKRNVE